MFTGRRGASASKGLFQNLEIRHFIHLHQNPVRERAATGPGSLISQQLDGAVEDSVIMRLYDSLLAVIDEPDHAPALDRDQSSGWGLSIHHYFGPVHRLLWLEANQRAGVS